MDAATRAGLVGRRRVLDSTPLYDAVATMDTVTLVRSAIRGVLAVCDAELEGRLRAVLGRDDDYRTAGKPVCDYDDPQAREALIDALAEDALAILVALEGLTLSAELGQSVTLMARLVGQDLDEGEDGVFRIARRVAKDRIISTVDPDARHGHKTSARGFDGYKGRVAVDPDSESITATTVTAGNVGDAGAAADCSPMTWTPRRHRRTARKRKRLTRAGEGERPASTVATRPHRPRPSARTAKGGCRSSDSAYGSQELVNASSRPTRRSTAGPPAVAPGGRFAKTPST